MSKRHAPLAPRQIVSLSISHPVLNNSSALFRVFHPARHGMVHLFNSVELSIAETGQTALYTRVKFTRPCQIHGLDNNMARKTNQLGSHCVGECLVCFLNKPVQNQARLCNRAYLWNIVSILYTFGNQSATNLTIIFSPQWLICLHTGTCCDRMPFVNLFFKTPPNLSNAIQLTVNGLQTTIKE